MVAYDKQEQMLNNTTKKVLILAVFIFILIIIKRTANIGLIVIIHVFEQMNIRIVCSLLIAWILFVYYPGQAKAFAL